jgi:hypothetical protein
VVNKLLKVSSQCLQFSIVRQVRVGCVYMNANVNIIGDILVMIDKLRYPVRLDLRCLSVMSLDFLI